jgi:hypothetical protein
MRKYINGKKIAYGGTEASRERFERRRRKTFRRIRNSKFGKTVERLTGLWPKFGGSLKSKFTDSDSDGILDTVTPNRRARSEGEYRQAATTPPPEPVKWGALSTIYSNLTNNWSTYK